MPSALPLGLVLAFSELMKGQPGWKGRDVLPSRGQVSPGSLFCSWDTGSLPPPRETPQYPCFLAFVRKWSCLWIGLTDKSFPSSPSPAQFIKTKSFRAVREKKREIGTSSISECFLLSQALGIVLSLYFVLPFFPLPVISP